MKKKKKAGKARAKKPAARKAPARARKAAKAPVKKAAARKPAARKKTARKAAVARASEGLDLRIRPVSQARDLEAVKNLLEEYSQLNGYEFLAGDIHEEIEDLPGAYGPSSGGLLLLATHEGNAAGCVGLRKLGGRKAELKNLFVPAHYRGYGISTRLVDLVISRAKAMGYRELVADTSVNMRLAMVVFVKHGFRFTDESHFTLDL